MLEELIESSSTLSASIERYSAACLAIQRSYARGEKPHIVTPQLPLRMEAQVEISASLEFRLRKATAAINWSKNLSNTRCTINSLPSELLAHIFRLVHRTHPCAKRDYDTCDTKIDPIYPVVLSVVCSRWREIAFSTPSLWSHIDISTSALLNQKRLSGLMKLHESQAGQLPLCLHIFDCSGYDRSSVHPGTMRELIAQVAGRATSFDFDVKSNFEVRIGPDTLSAFFKNCTPGKLARLTLTMPGDDDPLALTGNDDFEAKFWDMELDLPIKQLEGVLSHISALHLCNVYFPWHSCAYRGLVELRVTGLGSQTRIPESELTSILRSSPTLRVLQLDSIIQHPLPTGNQITPIPLNNLEALNLVDMSYGQIDVLLRWLAPNSKPLHFALQPLSRQSLRKHLKAETSISFFSRTCVTKAYLQSLEFSQIIELLELLPSLQMLALETKGRRSRIDESAGRNTAKLTSAHQLECLYIVSCEVEMGVIRRLISHPTLAIQNILFYDCTFFLGNGQVPVHEEASHMEELTQTCPETKFIIQDAKGPNPLETWELFPTSY